MKNWFSKEVINSAALAALVEMLMVVLGFGHSNIIFSFAIFFIAYKLFGKQEDNPEVVVTQHITDTGTANE